MDNTNRSKNEINEVLIKDLIREALKARERAYAPYSGFKVGAAVLSGEGEITPGFNIENASYGATNCAERTAIFSSLMKGTRKIDAIALTGDPENYTYPCGICRQVMAEFADPDMPVIIAKNEEEYIVHKLKEILPGAFTKDDLTEEKKKRLKG